RLLARGRVRAGVSVLDAARNPATRRVVAIVTLATALAVFSADAMAVGQRNRVAAAEQEIGAARTLTMLNPELTDVRAALAEVDPDGTQVTPVVRMIQPGVDAKETLAVVPDEFSRIALFPGGEPDDSTWDRLTTPEDTSIRFTASELTVDVVDSTLDSIEVDGERADVRLGLDLALDSGSILRSTLGTVPADRDTVSLRNAVACREGCRLVGIWVASLPGAEITGSATLRDLVAEPSGDVVALGPADQWQGADDGRAGELVASSSAPEELTITTRGRGTALLTLQHEWLPGVVPALVAGGLPPAGTPESFQLTALDGEYQEAIQVGTLERVPASGPETNVADLETLQRGRQVSPAALVEVWFADADPASYDEVAAALAERGITVAGTTTLDETVRGYDETTPAWSLQLAGLVGGVALLIALLVLLVSAVSGWRLRTRDLAALRMSGLSGRTVRRIAVAAQLPAVLVGVLAGTVAGLLGARLAMPLVPLFAIAPEVSSEDLSTAWWAAGSAALVALLVLGLGSVLIGRTLAARAELRRLRETM
ncbi:MAG: FtsX-like permease family protein, partial [Nocardioides sp.]